MTPWPNPENWRLNMSGPSPCCRKATTSGPANGFQRIIRQHPSSPFADNARFWLAESYYIIREFDAAEEHFRVVAETASATRQSEALLKLGFIHYERGQWQGARTYLRRVVDQHPETTSALLARDRLAELQAAGR
jgi:tol-pal system protein YbgF